MESPHYNWFYSKYFIWHKGSPQPGYSCCSAEAKLRLYEVLSNYYYYGRKLYGGNSRVDIEGQIWDRVNSVWQKLQRGENFKLNRWIRMEKTRGLPMSVTNPELLTDEELWNE